MINVAPETPLISSTNSEDEVVKLESNQGTNYNTVDVMVETVKSSIATSIITVEIEKRIEDLITKFAILEAAFIQSTEREKQLEQKLDTTQKDLGLANEEITKLNNLVSDFNSTKNDLAEIQKRLNEQSKIIDNLEKEKETDKKLAKKIQKQDEVLEELKKANAHLLEEAKQLEKENQVLQEGKQLAKEKQAIQTKAQPLPLARQMTPQKFTRPETTKMASPTEKRMMRKVDVVVGKNNDDIVDTNRQMWLLD